MEAPSMDVVYQAISALYDNPNTTEKEKASVWLGEVQKSIHSWKVADDLLQQKKSVHSCYFAAQTMRSKVLHNLTELSPESLVSLRDSLVVHLENTSPETSGIILTQLCLALADLALQMPNWHNCASDLIKQFSSNNTYALLEILTVLPQEIDSPNLKIGENRREEIKNDLRMNSQLVNLFLKEYLNSSQNSQVALKIINCLTSWIQVKAVNIQEVPQNAVIGLCLQVLKDYNSASPLHDAASDCICGLLCCLDANVESEIDKLLFDYISSLEESYHLAVAHEEETKSANYARVFTELAESFLEKIVKSAERGNQHFAIRSLELALICVGHHDYEIAEITFNLWFRLSEEVYQKDCQPLTDSFKPHVERLIEALARHCQLEPDLRQLPDEGDEFYEFRLKVVELIKDVVFIVGSSSVFRQMFTAIQSDISWEQTEAALFVMMAVAKNILPDEYEYVPKVVEATLSMPDTTHLAVRKTCIQLLGELCEWIDSHSECLEPCMELLIRALSDKDLAFAAATALQQISKACRAAPGAQASALLGGVRRAESLPLSERAAACLQRALAAAAARLPPDMMSMVLLEAVQIQLVPLAAMTAAQGSPSATEACAPLDRVAALFRGAEARDPRPALPALEAAWTTLEPFVYKFGESRAVSERWCRALRFALRCTRALSAPLAPRIAATLADLYANHRHSCVLYLASVLADELGADLEAARASGASLTGLLRALMPAALALLAPADALRDNPDTVDDLFRLALRYLQRLPGELAGAGAVGPLLQLAARAAALDHRDASASLMKFLADVAHARQEPALGEVAQRELQLQGPALVRALLEAAALRLRAPLVSNVAEALLALTKAAPPPLRRQLLADALLALPSAPPCATPEQKDRFLQLALKTNKVKELTKLLREFAKLHR